MMIPINCMMTFHILAINYHTTVNQSKTILVH